MLARASSNLPEKEVFLCGVESPPAERVTSNGQTSPLVEEGTPFQNTPKS
jgi:hypothetical protein